jgi:DTW domain-containing protein
MAERCYRCFKPVTFCRCEKISPIDTGIKFVFLMHPKEAYQQRTGTGRLTSISLLNSEIIIGIDFSENARLNELLSGKGDGSSYYPILLYPAKDAFFTDSKSFQKAIGDKKLLIILVDATWFFAKKMIKLSKNLHGLPKLSFNKEYRSQFNFKKQPSPECLSTIESTFYLIEELRTSGIAKPSADPSFLMTLFLDMVSYQNECERIRLTAGMENFNGQTMDIQST